MTTYIIGISLLIKQSSYYDYVLSIPKNIKCHVLAELISNFTQVQKKSLSVWFSENLKENVGRIVIARGVNIVLPRRQRVLKIYN